MDLRKIVEGPFDGHTTRYEDWFERNAHAYESELRAIKRMMPGEGNGLEVGVGTGRFAGPLSVGTGLDPSLNMLGPARDRGVGVIWGIGESLPFGDRCFDYVLVVTTICFFEDPRRALAEIHRVLKRDGVVVIGLIDRNSRLGRSYLERRDGNVFYRSATLYSFDEVRKMLVAQGFREPSCVQTLFEAPADLEGADEVRDGHGQGSFIVLRAGKAP